MDNPNTDTIQYIVLFSQRTVQEPSVSLFQKQELAVCSPAPFFCMIIQVTVGKVNVQAEEKDKETIISIIIRASPGGDEAS